jgi:hypothetical protein
MTLMRFHLIHLIENALFYVWHDSGNRAIRNAVMPVRHEFKYEVVK